MIPGTKPNLFVILRFSHKGTIGGILVGTISDIYGGRRACVIATFTITLLPFLLLFAEFGTLTTGMPTVSLMLLLGFMGCLIGNKKS